MKTITVVTPCYNEIDNIDVVHAEVKKVLSPLKRYAYRHLFIDNASTDGTTDRLKTLAKKDNHVQVIINARNFGWVKSPYYGMLQAYPADAIIIFVADLQDPAELISQFIAKWEQGYKIVVGVKTKSEEFRLMYLLRKMYYNLLHAISDEVPLLDNFTGYGLYDKAVIKILRSIDDSYPYFRGLIAEIGFPKAVIEYKQALRKHNKTKSSWFKLIDVGILGITSYSRLPLRMVTLLGFFLSFTSFLVAIAYLIYKVIQWRWFSAGIAPLVIGVFFFSSIQLLFIGIIGEYIGIIHKRIQKHPLVIEKERINM